MRFDLSHLIIAHSGVSRGTRFLLVVRSLLQLAYIVSSPVPKAQCPSVRLSTLSNFNISETSRLIVNKFHLEHHSGGGLAALCFGQDRIKTLASMATDSSIGL